ncbi:MAG: hypothetical protein QXG48_04255 [Thermofilaceae archaeon]
MSTYALAFALGLLYGRKVSAQPEPVEPVLEYIPVSEQEAPPYALEEHLVSQLERAGVPRELASATVERLKSLESLRSFAEAALKVERCYWVLRTASKALEEGRISPSVYQFITRRYLLTLSEVYPKLEELKVKADEEVRKALRSILTSQQAASPTAPGT